MSASPILAPSFREQLSAVLPPHTHYAAHFFTGWVASWSTPKGVWRVEVSVLTGLVPVVVNGPDLTWKASGDASQIIAVLRALGAIEPGPSEDLTRISEADELLDLAWGVIANADGWDRVSGEWREPAMRWRDRYHAYLDAGRALPEGIDEETRFAPVEPTCNCSGPRRHPIGSQGCALNEVPSHGDKGE